MTLEKAAQELVEEYNRNFLLTNRLQRFRDQLELLPDQRRRIPMWTPITEISPSHHKNLRFLDSQEFDGVMHYATGFRQGPRSSIENAIADAERAAESGDLDSLAQAIHRIVSDFYEAGMSMMMEASQKKRQSERAKNKRNRQPGLIVRGLMAILQYDSELTPAMLIDRLQECSIDCDDEDLRLELTGNDEVLVIDLSDNSDDTIPTEYLSTYMKRAKKHLRKQRRNN